MAAHSRYDVSDEAAGIDKNGILINKLGFEKTHFRENGYHPQRIQRGSSIS